MKLRHLSRIWGAVLARNHGLAVAFVATVAGIHGGSGVAYAQKLAPMTDKSAGFIPWAVAGGLGVVILLAAFINPKRSHTKK